MIGYRTEVRAFSKIKFYGCEERDVLLADEKYSFCTITEAWEIKLKLLCSKFNVLYSRYMYWSQWGNEPSIKRANMDGTNAKQITKGTNGRANALTIDYDGQRLYWVDFDINTIVSSDMNG